MWQNTWESRLPATPPPRGALDDEELFVVEGSQKNIAQVQFLVWSCAPVVVQQQVPWPTLLADAWFDSGYIFCVYLGAVWKNFTYFLREGGTQILKSTLSPALHSRSGEVCTVDASITEKLHLEIWTVFPMNPLYLADFFQLSADSAS